MGKRLLCWHTFITHFIILFAYSRTKIKKSHPNALHFDSFLLPAGKTLGNESHSLKCQHVLQPLYPFHTLKLHAVFVYGCDFTREMNILFIPNTVKILSVLIVLFMSLSAILLSSIRKRLKLGNDGQMIAFIDTISAFIGGGQPQIMHKFEKYMFSILWLAAFFIISLFSSDMLFYMYRILNQKITTFEQLSMVNSTIYNNPTLAAYENDIREMLRYTKKGITFGFYMN